MIISVLELKIHFKICKRLINIHLNMQIFKLYFIHVNKIFTTHIDLIIY